MRKPKLSTIVIIGTLFLISFLFVFPFQNLKGYVFEKIYKQTSILIVADDIYPSFLGWPGVGIKNVNVTIPIGTSELELASEKLTFKVGLSGLFPPIPAASMNLTKLRKGGDLYVKFAQSSNKMFLTLDAEEVNLEQLGFSGLSEPILGVINSDANLAIEQKDLSKSVGHVKIKGTNLKTPAHLIEGMPGLSFLIPGMRIGALDAAINIKNGTIEFNTFKFGDAQSDLSGSIAGDIRLGQDFQRSFINITLRLKLSNKILQDPQAKTFASFLEGYQSSTLGEYAMKWSASIQELTGLSIKILPEKVPN